MSGIQNIVSPGPLLHLFQEEMEKVIVFVQSDKKQNKNPSVLSVEFLQND